MPTRESASDLTTTPRHSSYGIRQKGDAAWDLASYKKTTQYAAVRPVSELRRRDFQPTNAAKPEIIITQVSASGTGEIA